MKRKTVQTKCDVPVRQAFRWDSNNHVQLKLPWLLESQLHGSQRKSYLSAPFFSHLRYEWLVRGRLYMPIYAVNCTTESAIYVMELTVMGWVSIGLKLNLHSWNKWIKVFLMNFKQEKKIDFIYSFVYNIYWVVGGKLY